MPTTSSPLDHLEVGSGVTHAVTMIYEYGGWHKELDEFLQANFGKNGNALIAVDQAAGHCDSQ
jgi:hypothetical protein